MSLGLLAVAEVSGRPDAERQMPHAELVDELVAKVPLAALSPDLALLAYAAPDAYPYKCVATHLNHRTGGNAHSVALTGQGLGAPFTALLVAAAYEQAGQSARSLIVIVEAAGPGFTGLGPAASLAPGPEPVDLDSGVLLAFVTGAAAWTIADVTAFSAPDELTAELRRLPEETLYVLGPGVTALAGWTDVHRTEAGSFCTRVWLALARNWNAWSSSRAVIALCDTDLMTGESHLAVLHRTAA